MSVLAVLAEVLFVGHSLVGAELPAMVETALKLRGQPEAQVQAQVINGAPLRWGWDHSDEGEGVDARARLAAGPVDALVLTEGIPLAAQVEWNDSADYVAQWAGAAWAGNPQAQVFIYETWHSLKSGTGVVVDHDPGAGVDWAVRIAADLPLWESLAAKADAARPEGAPAVRLIPAGQAMAQAAAAAAAGDLPGVETVQELFADNIHPNGKGLYLLAMVQVAALTGESPEGLQARLTRGWQNRDAVVSTELAQALQRIAWQAVQAQQQREAARPAAPLDVAEAVPAAPAPVAEGKAAAVDVAPAKPPEGPGKLRRHDPVTNPSLALGLSGVVDWTVAQPFVDVMKTARPWVGHLDGQWGGMEHDALAAGGWLDANGWLKAVPPGVSGVSTLVLTDLPADAGGVAGRYVLRWQGEGEIRLEGRARNVAPGAGGMTFDYEPGEGFVLVTIAATQPENPIRNITIVREDRLAAHAAGQIFNPDWLGRIRGVKMVRFMDWMMTNGAKLSRIEDSPKFDDYTWARNGVPMEVMVALANELRADAWFTVPHLADDALVRFQAETVADLLEPGLKAWVEYSNEMWNWQFAQTQWADEQGKALWGKEDGSVWVQFYARRATEVAGIWTDVFGDQAESRLVRVISSQTGWLGLEEAVLEAPRVVAEGRPAPKTAFDAYAVTGYFAGLLGDEAKLPLVKGWLAESAAANPAAPYALAAERAAEELLDGRHSGIPDDSLEDLLGRVLPYQAEVARKAGLDLVMYEGGSHVVGYGPVVEDAEMTAFFAYLNASAPMGALYERLLQGWAALSDAPFNSFGDVAMPTKWGSWGALRHLDDDTPRWAVLRKGCAAC